MDTKQSSSNEPTGNAQEPTTEKVPIKTKAASGPTKPSQDKPDSNDLSELAPDSSADEKTAEPAISTNKPGEVINPVSDSGTATTTNPVEVDPATFSAQPESQAVPSQTPPANVENTGPHANLQNAPAIVAPNRPRKGLRWVLILVVLLILGLSAAFAYFQYVAPKRALANYFGTLKEAQTGQFKGRVSTNVDSDSSEQAFSHDYNLTGQYDLREEGNSKISLSIESGEGDEQIKGELKSLDKTLYFRVEEFGALGILGLNLPDDWFKYELDEAMFSSQCSEEESDQSISILGERILSDIPITDTKTVGLFEEIEGRRTRHYQGKIDIQQAAQNIKASNEQLSDECKIAEFSEEEIEGLNVSYDLWSSSGFDRLVLHIKQESEGDVNLATNYDFTIDTFGYNDPVEIIAPENAKPIEEFYNSFGSNEALPSDDSADDVVLRARDDTRKNDLKNIKSNLEEYYSDHNAYPAILTDLSGFIPQDPNGGSYVYNPAPANCTTAARDCAQFTLKADLENDDDPLADEDGFYVVISVNQ